MYWMRIWKVSRTRFLYSRFDDRHRTERNFGILYSEVPFLLRGIAGCPDAYIFCESSKRMDENEKTLVGILVFDMIMGMLCLWAGGKRQDTTAPASQEVSTGKTPERKMWRKRLR